MLTFIRLSSFDTEATQKWWIRH